MWAEGRQKEQGFPFTPHRSLHILKDAIWTCPAIAPIGLYNCSQKSSYQEDKDDEEDNEGEEKEDDEQQRHQK